MPTSSTPNYRTTIRELLPYCFRLSSPVTRSLRPFPDRLSISNLRFQRTALILCKYPHDLRLSRVPGMYLGHLVSFHTQLNGMNTTCMPAG